MAARSGLAPGGRVPGGGLFFATEGNSTGLRHNATSKGSSWRLESEARASAGSPGNLVQASVPSNNVMSGESQTLTRRRDRSVCIGSPPFAAAPNENGAIAPDGLDQVDQIVITHVVADHHFPHNWITEYFVDRWFGAGRPSQLSHGVPLRFPVDTRACPAVDEWSQPFSFRT